MADVLIAVMPFAGHVSPVLRAAEALLAAGHVVRVSTGSAYQQAVTAVGAEAIPWSAAPDFDEHDLRATFPEVGRGGPAGLLANVEHVFIRSAVGQVTDLLAEFRRRPWDVLVADSLSLGGALAAERCRTPWASLSVVPLSMPSRDLPPPNLPIAPARGPIGRVRDAALRLVVAGATTGLRRAYRQVREAVGLDPAGVPLTRAFFSPDLILALGVTGLEPPRSDLPRHVHFIGAFPSPDAGPMPAWWPDVLATGRPVVHVTQGTFDIGTPRLLRPAVEALAGRPVTAVVAAGGAVRRPSFPLPANARAGGLLPYRELLPHTAVMVTNGGWGGVLAALSHGVPLVIAGADLDKPMIAAMVARSGAGIDLRTGAPSAAQVGRALDRIDDDAAYRQRAQALAAEFRAHDAARELVDLVGRLLATGGPVRRAGPA